MKIKILKALLLLAENDCNFDVHTILGIPRSTLWGYVAELEKETGLKLVERRRTNSFLLKKENHLFRLQQK